MEKPPFDPSKPYEEVKQEKPAFDPSKPYDAVEEAPQELPNSELELAKDLGKGAIGAAIGVAESFNIPRGTEILFRAPFQDVDQSKGFIDRMGERFQKAEEKAILPSVSEGAALARTGFRSLIDLIQFKKPDVGQIYSEESQAQKDFEAELPKGSKEAGEIGAGILSLADLARSGAKGLGAVAKLKNMSNEKAFDALKPLGKMADKIVDQGRAGQIGEQLIKDGIVTKGATFKDILIRTRAKLSDYGKQIGYYAKTADDAVARDSSLRGIPVDDLANSIKSQVIKPLAEDPSTLKVANEVSDWLDNTIAVTKNQDISYQQAQKFKSSLDKVKAKFKSTADSLSHDAFQDVYSILNRKIEDGISVILERAAPDITNDFTKVKQAYRNLSDAEGLISKTVSRASKNRSLSLTDYILGGTGGLAGVTALGPAGVVLGPGAAAANYVVRTRGNQLAASGLKSLADVINNATSLKDFGTAAKASSAINLLRPKGSKEE